MIPFADSGGVGNIAAAVLDDRGIISAWTPGAQELLGYPEDEVLGRSARFLLADPAVWAEFAADRPLPADSVWAVLRHQNGTPVSASLQVTQSGGRGYLIVAIPAGELRTHVQDEALAVSLFATDQLRLCLYDLDLRIQRAGPALGDVVGRSSGDLYAAEDAEALEQVLRQVAETGDPVSGWEHRMRPVDGAGPGLVLSFTALRVLRPDGSPAGVATVARDVTVEYESKRRLDVLHHAATEIGVSLDVAQTAEAVAKVFVPGFASWAAVDVGVAVLDGTALPTPGDPWPTLQRQVAVAYRGDTPPLDLELRKAFVARVPSSVRTQALRQGRGVLTPNLSVLTADDTEQARFLRTIYPDDAHSVIIAPFFGSHGMLGVLGVARTVDEPPFDREDMELVEEIAARATLNINNAWRFAREHQTAVALQLSLLPRSSIDTPAAETAGLYLSAGVGTGVSGDWFDVIRLSSLRSAFVVGDVVGHGLQATATMGRLATAVQTLADLDLDPGEVLARLDDLVVRLASEQAMENPGTADSLTRAAALGATCLYAVHDPVSRRCVVASAGHPPPILLQPKDGTAHVVQLTPGPPLGIGGMPFETTELELPEGSILAFYTDGLVQQRGSDIEQGMARLRRLLDSTHRPGIDLHDLGRGLVSETVFTHPTDDAALLLARTRAVSEENTFFRELAADDAVVAKARSLVTDQLAIWNLDELSFTAEIIVSELVTNAIRHAGGPVGLRLVRDGVLVCEVTDPSNTQPRLRRAQDTDEGGRGLFIVAQLAQRWGSRYARSGKTIWAELGFSEPA